MALMGFLRCCWGDKHLTQEVAMSSSMQRGMCSSHARMSAAVYHSTDWQKRQKGSRGHISSARTALHV